MGGSEKLPRSGPGSYTFREHRRYLDALLASLLGGAGGAGGGVGEQVPPAVEEVGRQAGATRERRGRVGRLRRQPGEVLVPVVGAEQLLQVGAGVAVVG
jgi:haloalkane dehalogenase